MKSRALYIIFLFGLFIFPSLAKAASLSISPASGTFSVGSTFSVPLYLDTNGKSINALSVSLSFPQDLLQVVSPSTGQSIIGVWTATPKFDNENGRVELQGGIPGGITVSKGLITTLTFRVKAVGQAILKYSDGSKVFLNDGLGTNDLTKTDDAVYKFVLPPPAGPTVVSDTDPDQNVWYPSRTASFSFKSNDSNVQGYSYILSDDPLTVPDDISEGMKDSVSYTSLSDGIHYFHVKVLRNGLWGGTTHFSVKIDASPPADFNIDIVPASVTSIRQPIIQFLTTDAFSGIDHYEIKIIPLSDLPASSTEVADAHFFIESTSPYFPPKLDLGSYDVIVRAYDKASNYKQITKRLEITTPVFFMITTDGLKLGNNTIAWQWVYLTSILLIILLSFALYKARGWHVQIHVDHASKKLPEDVVQQLEELKKYREKYGAKIIMLLLILSSLFGFGRHVLADTVIAPPLISTVSENVSNQEIFYAGGKTELPNEHIILYLQNLSTGETYNENVDSDEKGDWLYRHDTFLSPGNYLLWAQAKIGDQMSPPGPQVKMTVNRTAIQFGGSRISYEAIYLTIIIVLVLIIMYLLAFIIYHVYQGRKKHRLFQNSVKEAEESIKRGFAVLKHDIENELQIVQKAKLRGELSFEEKEKEEELKKDLENVQTQLGREIWELENLG